MCFHRRVWTGIQKPSNLKLVKVKRESRTAGTAKAATANGRAAWRTTASVTRWVPPLLACFPFFLTSLTLIHSFCSLLEGEDHVLVHLQVHRLQKLRGEPGEEDADAPGGRGGGKGAAADGGQDETVLTDLRPAHADDARHFQRRREVRQTLFSPTRSFYSITLSVHWGAACSLKYTKKAAMFAFSQQQFQDYI